MGLIRQVRWARANMLNGKKGMLSLFGFACFKHEPLCLSFNIRAVLDLSVALGCLHEAVHILGDLSILCPT